MMWLLLSCGGFDPTPLPTAPPERPVPRSTGAFAFAHHTAEGRFSLPDSVRPGGQPAEAEFAALGRLVKHETRNRTHVYRLPLPVHDNLLPTRMRGTHSFGSEPPPGFEVIDAEGQPVPFERHGHKPGTYGFDRDYLYLGVRRKQPPPEGARVRFPKATATENALNFATAGLSTPEFVSRNLTVGQTSHTGLLLPAPAEASWTVEVPERGRLAFLGTVLEPAIAHPESSDGATVRVVVTDAGQEHAVGWLTVTPKGWASARFDLAAFAGRTVELTFRTEPGPTAAFDYVFLEDPTLYTPSDHPRRAVLVFVDTLRHDHLGMYGYDRPTSPTVDHWAEGATVFDDARSVAPWTLPSARAVLSGRQPELWYEGPTLASRLSEQGWHTEAVVSNAFLSQPFDVHRGWDRFHYDHLMPARELVAHAQRTLSRYPDRDVLLLVHFMEPHLPYMESWWYQRRFAGSRPDALEHLTHNWLVDLPTDDPAFDEIRDHVIDRYDQNIRATDDALAALFASAGADATTVLFSDHGEEFWDHGGFEHGHSFHDELLRVPLAIRSPSLPPGRVAAPVSLLDITPTLLELSGAPPLAEASGRSLVPAAWGDEGADDELAARPQGFGRPLYGDDGWGVVADGHKWWDRGGQQQLYSLQADPAESLDLAPGADDLSQWPAALGEALDREVALAWRVSLRSRTWPFPVTVTVSHPDGVRQAWSAYDPRGRAAASVARVVDGALVLDIPTNQAAPEALFVVPTGDARDLDGLTVTIAGRQVDVTATVPEGTPRPPLTTARRTPVLAADAPNDSWGFSVDLGWAPLPEGIAVAGFHPDLEQQLRELGYLDE